MEWHSGKSAVSFGNPFCGCCLFGPCPVFCLVCCFLLTKRKSGWGICGSSWLLALVCLLDSPAFMDQLCPCTNVFLTAYSHVRTEPLSDIGQTRGKKKSAVFFCPSPLPFGGSTVLSLTRGPAGNRTTTGSLSATQECRDTNCTTRTTPLDALPPRVGRDWGFQGRMEEIARLSRL